MTKLGLFRNFANVPKGGVRTYCKPDVIGRDIGNAVGGLRQLPVCLLCVIRCKN